MPEDAVFETAVQQAGENVSVISSNAGEMSNELTAGLLKMLSVGEINTGLLNGNIHNVSIRFCDRNSPDRRPLSAAIAATTTS